MGSKKVVGVRTNRNYIRHFSEGFKRQKVRDLETNQVRVIDLCREYNVSTTSVYNWLNKYSSMRKKGERQVVQSRSDTGKIKALREQIASLEQLLGQKQVEIEFKDKLIELAEEMYNVDIKKKLGSIPSNGSGATGKNIQ